METIAYQIAGAWTEVAMGGIGAAVAFRITYGTHGGSTCVIPLPILPPETAPAIPFEAPCIVRTGRTGSAGSYSGGSILFQGRRTDDQAQVSAHQASHSLTLEDAWYDLRFLTYQSAWANITGYTGSTPTYGAPLLWPDCVLFQASLAGPFQPNGTFGTYTPLPVNLHITTGQAIQEILAYAIYCGVNLQIGQIDPAVYVPFYPVRSMRCADALKTCLRVHPDCACEIDYTTTPPTFNVRARSSLVSVALPYRSQSGNQRHLTSSVQPRPELQPSRVGVYIKSTTTINGTDVVGVGTDIYPPGAASGLRSLDASVDMTGPKLAKTVATLASAAFDPTSLAWWARKVPSLKPQSAGGQIPNSGTGALALLDATVNGGLTIHPKGIQVTDDSGNPIDITTAYPYELTAGAPAAWMGVTVMEANVAGFFSYYKQTTAGAAQLVDQIGEHLHTCRVKLTNRASATYSQNQLLATGEVYPPGLAQGIYNSLAALQYNFTHTILESPFATVIKPGKHALNLSGGAPAWATMNAMVQSVEIELTFSAGSGVTTARTTVHCGPVDHLEAGELVQIFNLFCNRDLSRINPAERTGGTSMSGGSVTLGSDSPMENSVAATPVAAVQNFAAPDATQSGITNVVTQDATVGQIVRAQQNTATGATIAAGIIAPEYSGAGAPSSTTLAASSYYRAGDKYVDTAANALYRCTASGGPNVGNTGGSVWMQISGGTGTVGQYFAIIGLTLADYVSAVPLVITSTSGLTVTPGTAVLVAKQNRMRPSVVSEVIDGVTITYSAYTDDNNRTATDTSSNSEFQVAFPRYLTMYSCGFSIGPYTGAPAYQLLKSLCVIKAVQIVGGAPVSASLTGAPAWEEITPRVWARRYSQ